MSTKMYFGQARTIEWMRSVAEIARTHPAIQSGVLELFVLPSFPLLPSVLDLAEGTGIRVGAQNIAVEDSGAFTGEVSGALLAEMGVSLAEVGHAERRRLFGETPAIVTAKTRAALRNGLTPVLCIGEETAGSPKDAATDCVGQIIEVLDGIETGADVIVAYEPQWAIGAVEPASVEHISEVCARLRDVLETNSHIHSGRVIYGGSAGPGLLGRLGAGVDGLFLGRFAHDPRAVAAVLDEVLKVRSEEIQ
ncbi:triose-phosphate isomerase family protein [Cryobacterium sp. Hh7]|uniref:triose-phosphate isomerase family protein n=1 Tax=Cryobacterium sp. Hh7 TaxID=1259159 RepID=UPI001F5453AF|nr:triose-phosphate isomerase family protein [Cryobacterium sp. Hh7]